MSLLRRHTHRRDQWPWRRLWLPKDVAPRLDAAGFLHAPSWLRVAWTPEPVPLEALGDIPCVIALGDPGLGKSHAVEDYAATLAARVPHDHLLALDLGEFGSRDEVIQHVFRSPTVEAWTGFATPVHLVLDSLDESPIPIETLCGLVLDELSRLLERVPASRLRLLIACRTAVMPPDFVPSLRILFAPGGATEAESPSQGTAGLTIAGGESSPSRPAAERPLQQVPTGATIVSSVPAGRPQDVRLPTSGDSSLSVQPVGPGPEGCVVVEITVIRREDARVAAAAVLGNEGTAGAFLDAVINANAGAFAARPITLRALLARHRAGRPLSGSQSDLYRDLCRELCESVAARPGAVPAYRVPRTTLDERYRIAGRLAAAMLFGNLRGVWCSEGPPPTSELLDPRECDGVEHMDGTVLRVDAVTAAEALNTALFTGRAGDPGGDNAGKALAAHQTFAEFLAADWVRSRDMDLPQLLSLLHDPTDPERRVVPQLRQVAAWLASMRADVFDALAPREPELLLGSDIVHVPEERREALVASLLARTADNRVVRPLLGGRLAYDRLGHSRLEAQLGGVIADSALPYRVRDRALEIARACRVEALGPLGAELALDESQHLDLRVAAAMFVAEAGGEAERWMLMPLVAEQSTADEAEELRGAALLATWTLFTPDELFTLLTHPRRPNWGGAYGIALSEIAEGLSADYVIAAAQWLACRGPGTSAGALREVAEAALSLALAHVAHADVRAPLLTYVRRRLRRHMPLAGRLTGELPARVQEALDLARDGRRRLVSALLDGEPGWPTSGTAASGMRDMTGGDGCTRVDGARVARPPRDPASVSDVSPTTSIRWLGRLMPELFSSADVPWSLEVMVAMPLGDDRRVAWREAVRAIFHPLEQTHLEAAQRYRNDADVAYATQDWSTHSSLEAAREALASALRDEREAEAAMEAEPLSQAGEDDRRGPAPLAERVTHILTSIAGVGSADTCVESGTSPHQEWSPWARIFFALVLDPTYGRHFGSEPLPETLAILSDMLPTDQLHRVFDTALAYLNGESAAPDPYPPSGQLPWTSLHGAAAALLVARLAPSRLSDVAPEAWREWLPTLLRSEPFGGSPDHAPVEIVLNAAARAVPEAFHSALLGATDAALRDLKRRVATAALRLAVTTDEVAQELARRAAARAYAPRQTEMLLRKMLRAGGGSGSAARRAAAELLVAVPAEAASQEAAAVPPAEVGSVPDESREAGIAAAAALIAADEDAGWALVGTRISEDRAFARDVLLFGAEHERLLNAGAPDRLSEIRLADLYLIALREFPPESDPWHVGAFSLGPRDYVQRWRDGLLSALANRGTDQAVEALARIAAASPERDWLVQAWLRAAAARFGARWAGTPPRTLMELAAKRHLRQVQSGEQLLDIIEESLTRLQTELQGEWRSVVGLWDEQRTRPRRAPAGQSERLAVKRPPSKWRPKDEGHLANELARHLRRDIGGRGIVVGRELVVQVGISGGAPGLRTDLDIRARPAGESPGTIPDVRVIIEVKGSWNREVLTAMRTQLVEDYLDSLHVRHGMYVVGDYACDAWEDSPDKARSLRLQGRVALTRHLTEQANGLSTPMREVRAIVLDVSLPAGAIRSAPNA